MNFNSFLLFTLCYYYFIVFLKILFEELTWRGPQSFFTDIDEDSNTLRNYYFGQLKLT